MIKILTGVVVGILVGFFGTSSVIYADMAILKLNTGVRYKVLSCLKDNVLCELKSPDKKVRWYYTSKEERKIIRAGRSFIKMDGLYIDAPLSETSFKKTKPKRSRISVFHFV